MENKDEKNINSRLGCFYLIIICLILGSCMFGGDDAKEKYRKSVSTVQTSETKNSKPVVKKTPEEIAQKKYDDWFSIQFSPWDGAFRSGERYIKRNMNDPDSYEHVATNCFVYPYIPNDVDEMLHEKGYKNLKKGDFIAIMKFRGKNAFGGKVLDNQIFLCYYNGPDKPSTFYVIPKHWMKREY